MSASSQNLIEIQSNLQDPANVTMQDLIKYANGGNPEVPSFLALIEMNRRKQIAQTAQGFQTPQGTVKDQTINSMMGKTDPTAAPQGIAPTAAPQGIAPTAMPQGIAPTAMPQGIDPTAQPKPVQAAEGGLMSIPVNNMFNAKNYAGGGIVAFDEGGETKYDPATATRRADYEEPKEAAPAPARKSYKLGDQTIEAPRGVDEILRGLPSIAPMQGTRPNDMTPEQAYKRQQEIQKLAGVSQDPYADTRKRQEAIEARQAEEHKGDAMDRLLAQAEAFATADPTKGFGFAGAASSKASRSLEAEQRAIRDKQEALGLEIARGMAEKEDARRRGDAKGVESAIETIKKDQSEFDKLQMKRDELVNAQYKTAHDIQSGETSAAKVPVDLFNAQTQRDQANALASHYRNADELAALTKPTADDITYNRLIGKVNQDPVIKMLAGELKGMEPGSPEYVQIEQKIYNKMKTIFAQHPNLLPPEPEQVTPSEGPKKKQSFDEWFKEAADWGWYPGKKGGAPGPTAPRTVSFDQLPK